MKKILLLILAIGIIVSIDSQKIFSFFMSKNQDVIATVNGEEITLTDVESIYDMRYALTPLAPPSVIQLQLEYAELLYARIEQILIAQELQKKNLSITDERVNAFESIVRKDYKDVEKYENITFDKIIENTGMDYPFWKEQLKIRLEIETLKKDIAENIVIDSEEIIKYIEDHPNLANTPDNVDFIVIKSFKKSQLEEIKKKKTYNYEENKNENLEIKRGLFELANVPKEYVKDLQQMKPFTFSEIKSDNESFYLLYLNAYEKNQGLGPLRLYSIAEKELLELKTPAAYDRWLIQTLENAEITIAKDFLPKNLPNENLSEGIYSILQELPTPSDLIDIVDENNSDNTKE